MKAPDVLGCRWCGDEQLDHIYGDTDDGGYARSVGWHLYEPPTREQRQARALAAEKARLESERKQWEQWEKDRRKGIQ